MPPKRKVEQTATETDVAPPRRSTRHASTSDNQSGASKKAPNSSGLTKATSKTEVKGKDGEAENAKDKIEEGKPDVQQQETGGKETREGVDSAESKDTKADHKDEAESVNKRHLKVGDIIPSASLLDSNSKEISLLAESSSNPDTKGLVLFSYPAASTPGCTSQACSYRDAYEEIQKLGYAVFGISTDTPAAQEKFRGKHGFKYPLLSDPKKLLLGPLGGSVASKKTALRCHWVIKRGGELASIEIGVKPKDCVTKALKTIDSLN